MRQHSVRKEAVKISGNTNSDVVKVTVKVKSDVKKDIEDIAGRTSKAISSSFGKVGKEMEKSISKPAKKVKVSLAKSMDSVNKSVQSVSKNSKGLLDKPVENVKQKVTGLKKELDGVLTKMSSMRKIKIKNKNSVSESSSKGTDKEAEAAEKSGEEKKTSKMASAFSAVWKGTVVGIGKITKGTIAGIGKIISGIGQKLSGIAQNIKSVFKSALSSVGTYAANMMGSLIKENAAFQASLNQIGTNMQVAFMPIVQSVMPAVNALAQGLTYLTGRMAAFTSSFFGTTVEQSTAAVKALKNTGKEAKKAVTLAGIDEINNIGSGSSEETSGASSVGGFAQSPMGGQEIVQNITATMTQIAAMIPNFIAQVLARIAECTPYFVQAASNILNTFLTSLNSRWEEISLAGISIVTNLMNGLVMVAPQLGLAAANIVTLLLQVIFASLPKLFEFGIQFLTSFLTGIAEKMPELMVQMQGVVISILNTITNNLPAILQSGMSILLSLINGISQCLPNIMTAITTVVMQIIQVLTDNLPQIVQAGVDLLVSLLNGILGSLDVIIEQAPKIIESLVTGLMNAIPILIDGTIEIVAALIDAIMKTDWIKVGKDIISAIWNGIKNGAKSIEQYLFGDTHRGGSSTFFGTLRSAFPSFASGGIVSQPTLAMVGDNKRSPEAITPLHELYGLVKSAVAEGNQNSGFNQQPLSFALQIDGERIMEWVYADTSFGRRRSCVLAT